MRWPMTCLIVLMMLGFLPEGFGQAADPPQTASAQSFDPHDLSGIWIRNAIYTAMSPNMPPLTSWGQAKFDSNRPSVGRGSRVVSPSVGNDPLGLCDPLGIPRTLLEFVYEHPRMEFIQLPKEMLQLIMLNRDWREIWTDGQALPKDPDPTFMGYSVGKWEGDEFVIDSVGFDERTWLDAVGYPHSDEMHLQERYRRIDHDTLNLTFIVNDPKTYTKPAASSIFVWKLTPETAMTESFCVPSEEQSFNQEIRNPAGGTSKP